VNRQDEVEEPNETVVVLVQVKAFESNPESAKIVAVGFMAANISAICTWILFPES